MVSPASVRTIVNYLCPRDSDLLLPPELLTRFLRSSVFCPERVRWFTLPGATPTDRDPNTTPTSVCDHHRNSVDAFVHLRNALQAWRQQEWDDGVTCTGPTASTPSVPADGARGNDGIGRRTTTAASWTPTIHTVPLSGGRNWTDRPVVCDKRPRRKRTPCICTAPTASKTVTISNNTGTCVADTHLSHRIRREPLGQNEILPLFWTPFARVAAIYANRNSEPVWRASGVSNSKPRRRIQR